MVPPTLSILILILISTFYIVDTGKVENKYVIQVKSFECKSFVPYMLNVTCSVKNLNRSTNILNVDSVFTKLQNNVSVRVEMFYKYSFSYKPFMINQTEDFCAYMRGDEKKGPVMNLVLKSAKPYMNNVKCPLLGHASLVDYPMRLETYLGLMPQGYYRVDVTALTNKKPFFLLRCFCKYVLQ